MPSPLPPLLSPQLPLPMVLLLAIPMTTLVVGLVGVLAVLLLLPPSCQLARHLSSPAAVQEAAEGWGGRRKRRGDPRYPTVAMTTSRNLGGRGRKEAERKRKRRHRRLTSLLCRPGWADAAVA